MRPINSTGDSEPHGSWSDGITVKLLKNNQIWMLPKRWIQFTSVFCRGHFDRWTIPGLCWARLRGVYSVRVSDRDAHHRPSTWNTTWVKKKRGGGGGRRNYTFCPIFMKNRGRNTFSSFLLKYRVRNYTNFPETWKRGSKWRSICNNLHRVSTPTQVGDLATHLRWSLG